MNCNECKFNENDECLQIADCYNKQKYFKPKEKPMENKVIFESDRKFEEFTVEFREAKTLGDCKKIAEKYNLIIRKSAVDEAEEMYNNFDNGFNLGIVGRDKIIHKQHEAIQELKAENERLKK